MCLATGEYFYEAGQRSHLFVFWMSTDFRWPRQKDFHRSIKSIEQGIQTRHCLSWQGWTRSKSQARAVRQNFMLNMGLPWQHIIYDLLKEEGSYACLNPILIHSHWILDKTFRPHDYSNVDRIITPRVWNPSKKRISTVTENTANRVKADSGIKKQQLQVVCLPNCYYLPLPLTRAVLGCISNRHIRT